MYIYNIYIYLCVCVCVCVCVCLCVWCYISAIDRCFFSLVFLYPKSIWNTEAKCFQVVNTLKSLTKKLKHLNHIKWSRRCKSLTF